MWDVHKQEPVGQPIRNPDEEVTVLGFSPDSKFLYTFGVGKMTVWSLDPQDWLTRICQIANRNFTQEEWSLYLDQAAYHADLPSRLPSENIGHDIRLPSISPIFVKFHPPTTRTKGTVT